MASKAKIAPESQEERELVAQIRQWQQRVSAVNTNPPAGFEATCPECEQPSHSMLIKKWGHCMACHRRKQGV